MWHNTLELQRARLEGEDAYARRLRELEVLSAARVVDLLGPARCCCAWRSPASGSRCRRPDPPP